MKTVAAFPPFISIILQLRGILSGLLPICLTTDKAASHTVSARGTGPVNHPANDLVLFNQALIKRSHALICTLLCSIQNLIQQVYRTMQLTFHCVKIVLRVLFQSHFQTLPLTIKSWNISVIDAVLTRLGSV